MADNGFKERRKTADAWGTALRAQLNDVQRLTLAELERFGWEIQFVRRPLFLDPIPVVADGEKKLFAVLTPEGELDETPQLALRRR